MATRYSIFPSIDSGSGDDRVYNAVDFLARPSRDHLSGEGDGVGRETGDSLEVTETSPASLAVSVGTGVARANGYRFEVFTAAEELSLSTADPSDDRIDRIVVQARLDSANRDMRLTVIEGTPASSPSAPALTRDSDTYEISLAQVLVGAGVSSVSNTEITDERGDTSLCGWLRAQDSKLLEGKAASEFSQPGDNVSDFNNDAGYFANGNSQLKVGTTSGTIKLTESDTTDLNTRILLSGGQLTIQQMNDAEDSFTSILRFVLGGVNTEIVNGNLFFGNSDPSAASGAGVAQWSARSDGQLSAAASDLDAGSFNRCNSDGIVISIYQDGTREGDISVSGTTVSYNGAHLARWSQLPGRSRQDIPRGTVMTMIDEMCEWDGEDNEQLTKSKVSDTPSDRNVSGIFDTWDDEDPDGKYDGIEDFYIANTGDFVIRVTGKVELGDLLESAGDGTARAQLDQEQVKRSTVAKATRSHNGGGEVLLPCLLMIS